MADPIVIPCEGSGCPTHNHGHALGICSMCGNLVVTEDDGRAYRHDRQDVLAMLHRGDFDMPTARSRRSSTSAASGHTRGRSGT